MLWSQRFFDHNGIPDVDPPPSGWLATAYPVNTSSAYATPDPQGRLRCDHINKDRWCHNFRHYLKPRGRYELLWRSLLAELKLSADPSMPELENCGIDVVLERTHPLSRPLILSSRRLDQPTSPGNTVPPGETWEVIIARHPEQQLDSSNQTLRRRLGYQQQAFTLTREFAEFDWATKFSAILSGAVIINCAGSEDKPITACPKIENTSILESESHIPAPPKEYPAPEPMSCPTNKNQLELAITTRLPSFQQGAMVLQWQGLPHFYKFHLTVVAQAASVCSPTTTVVQKSFDYRSPPPKMERVPGSEYVRVRLEPLWDSIRNPKAAKIQWSSDQPKVKKEENSTGFEVHLSESAFPDPHVIYQVIHEFSGNVEVQLEISANIEQGTFELRRLGRQYKKPEKVDLMRDGERYWLQFKLEPENPDDRMNEPKIRSRRGSALISDVFDITPLTSSEDSTNGAQ